MAEQGRSKQRKLPPWILNLSSTSKTEGAEIKSKTCNVQDTPVLKFIGSINYCRTAEDCSRACEDLIKQAHTKEEIVLGFDMEWPVDFKTGSGKTALIQVCAEEKICHLFHVSFMRNLPVAFVHLLQHPKVKLVGVNIENDLWKLSRDYDIIVKPLIESRVVDLRDFANKALQCNQTWSLDRLVLYVLKMRLNKEDTIRKSDWNVMNLSNNQQCYAATDAYASLLLYNHLKMKTKGSEQH